MVLVWHVIFSAAVRIGGLAVCKFMARYGSWALNAALRSSVHMWESVFCRCPPIESAGNRRDSIEALGACASHGDGHDTTVAWKCRRIRVLAFSF